LQRYFNIVPIEYPIAGIFGWMWGLLYGLVADRLYCLPRLCFGNIVWGNLGNPAIV
jgi:hypothetical protein